MDDELVTIKGLYAYINMNAYRNQIRMKTRHTGDFAFSEADMPLRVNTLYPATNMDKTWISITTPRGSMTSFPVDLVERFTNIVPEWDKLNA